MAQINIRQQQNNIFLIAIAFLFALASTLVISSNGLDQNSAQNRDSFDGKQWCVKQTGLYQKDIIEYHLRNENCAVDCQTRKSQLVSFHRENTIACGGNNNGDQNQRYCYFGKCISEDEETIMYEKIAGLSNVSLTILEANVWNEDPPGAGESDVFVHVKAQENCGPFYKLNDTICHTFTKSNSNHPIWHDGNNNKGFTCKMMPIPRECNLIFVIMDSDDIEHDHLFDQHANIGQLLANRRGAGKLGDQYHVIVQANEHDLLVRS